VEYAIYSVSQRDREPLLRYMVDALEAEGCAIIRHTPPTEAPFRISFETPAGERLGIIAYAFRATFTPTKNRPADEHSFQIKYGSKQYRTRPRLHELWQDPYGLYTTICCGINTEQGFFVGIDPEMHNPTKFFIRVEFKQHHVDEILRLGWHTWERDVRRQSEEPIEVFVGGTARSFLRYLRFERAALREDQGHRKLLAERIGEGPTSPLFVPSVAPLAVTAPTPAPQMIHALAQEFEMTESQVLDVIANARRLKMAARGWVAEAKLLEVLSRVDGVTDCVMPDEEGKPDLRLRFRGVGPVIIECKNVARDTLTDGTVRLDFQKTRTSKSDPCSRYYRRDAFHLVAACLHAVTVKWEFKFALPSTLDAHKSCVGRLSNNVRLDSRWTTDAAGALALAAADLR
jgi:hypothetical protein